jgi:3-hydroxy-9,10-secoandrosta-1,3,5(10)-triene-9,17-dione monooxygenase reductase component
MNEPSVFNTRDLRNAFGTFATGVSIVTTRAEEGRDVGLTANSFSTVSLSPPMILWSLAKSSSNIEAFRRASHFAVHILAADQEALSARFAAKVLDRFDALPLERGPSNTPLLRDCTARFACRTAFQYEGGDHVIFVGEVVDFAHSERPPLVFHGGRYGMLLRKEAAPPPVPNEGTVSPSPNDLIYHIAQIYYRIRRNATLERRRRGLSEHDYIALSVLSWKEDCRFADIDEFAQTRGWRATPEMMNGLIARELVQAPTTITSDSRIALTEKGRQSIIELMAMLKAGEAEAVESLDPSETQVLKQLLRRVTVSRSSA